jgi:YegS/Rv2252/BmrU family lipid kinase
MATKRALVLVNKKARQGGEDLDQVLQVLEAGGIVSVAHQFDDEAQMMTAMRQRHPETDRIIIGGGDGTLNSALESVLESELPLGVLPMGTANDLARTLEIPFEPAEAAEVIVRGRTVRIDLGWVNGRHYFNVANVGLATNVSKTLTTEMKQRWGVLAYPLAMYNAYRINRPFKARIVCDGQKHRMKSIQIAIGNGRHYGGGLTIRNDAFIDDQRLDFYSIEPQSTWKLLKSLPAIVRGTFRQGDMVRLMDGQEIEVTTDRTMPVETDGEEVTETPALFRVKHAALPIFVP